LSYGFILGNHTFLTGWQSLKIGTGGFLTGLSVANDDTLVVRTDTYGAYKWNPSAVTPTANNGAVGAWQQLVSPTSMPRPLSENAQNYGYGVFEIRVAPSNSAIMYMVYLVFPSGGNAGIYKSTDGGATWAQTAFTPVAQSFASMDSNRTSGNKMAIHPTNPSVVFAGFESTAGLFCTLDGGTTWNAVSNLPAAAGAIGVLGLQFDPSTPNTLYAYSDGTGIYKSTNANLGASSTWTKINSGVGPSTVYCCDITPAGKYYVVAGVSADLWSYNGSWTHELISSGSTTGTVGVACDPSNSSHVVAVGDEGQLNENLGSGWGGWTTQRPPPTIYGDIPWEGAGGFSIFTVAAAFSRTVSGKLYVNGENSFFTSTLSGAVNTGSTITWSDMGTGEEQLVGNVIVCPSASKPVFGGWDHAIIAPTDLTKYPTTFGPVADQSLNACWSIDFAKNNSLFLVCICDGVPYGGNGVQRSGWSTDGGQTWNLFGSGSTVLPNNVWGTAGDHGGGCIAVSTSSNFIWAASEGVAPQYTLDGGASWTSITLPGVASFSGFLCGAENLAIQVIADATIGTFYLWFNGKGIFKTTDGGANWTSLTVSPGMVTVQSIGAVPGQPGHLWGWNGVSGTPGNSMAGGAYPANQDQVYYGVESGGTVTLTQVNNAKLFFCMGFGAPAPGQSYPAVYGVGYTIFHDASTSVVAGTGLKTVNVGAGLSLTFTVGAPCQLSEFFGTKNMAGIISSYNNATGALVVDVDYNFGTAGTGTNWVIGVWGVWQNTGGESATPIWKQLGPWPNNSFDTARSMCGDPSVFGRVYIALAGSGAALGQF
jgi:hypothetical protein